MYAAASTFSELAEELVQILDTGAITLIVFGLVVYFWGIAINIPHFGGEKGGEKQKSFFIWGIIILFAMVSIWGIIALLKNTLFGSTPFEPYSGSGPSGVTYCDAFGKCN